MASMSESQLKTIDKHWPLAGISGTATAGCRRCRGRVSCGVTPASATGNSRRRCCSGVPWWRGVFRGCGRAASMRSSAACCRCDRCTTRWCRQTRTAGPPSLAHPGPLDCSPRPCLIYPRQQLQPGTAKMTRLLNSMSAGQLRLEKASSSIITN